MPGCGTEELRECIKERAGGKDDVQVYGLDGE